MREFTHQADIVLDRFRIIGINGELEFTVFLLPQREVIGADGGAADLDTGIRTDLESDDAGCEDMHIGKTGFSGFASFEQFLGKVLDMTD